MSHFERFIKKKKKNSKRLFVDTSLFFIFFLNYINSKTKKLQMYRYIIYILTIRLGDNYSRVHSKRVR